MRHEVESLDRIEEINSTTSVWSSEAYSTNDEPVVDQSATCLVSKGFTVI